VLLHGRSPARELQPSPFSQFFKPRVNLLQNISSRARALPKNTAFLKDPGGPTRRSIPGCGQSVALEGETLVIDVTGMKRSILEFDRGGGPLQRCVALVERYTRTSPA